MQSSNKKVLKIVTIGLMAALVFVTSKFLTIPIATIAGTPTRIHFGNVMCILSGLLFGGMSGGISAGIGSAFMDLLDPVYITSTPTTLINKFVMGFLAGKLSHHGKVKGDSQTWNIIAAIVGQFTYIVLYLLKTFIEMKLLGNDINTIWIAVGEKAISSSINGIIAVVVAVPLALALRQGLKQTSIFKELINA